ncbi:hypothetical protein O3Q52_11085 [Streptomyces sp. ActVer]|uniref:hypothetical protein n=1 Tax=Streptomyces sp. ActVer TaxID=3014558 RepID=UPI0022B55E0F|nr:hypothetical protein [Streptomyces sp. ActVer]MCZ4508738.1 hypothetical protein [Streptomyces sp. ActVer]
MGEDPPARRRSPRSRRYGRLALRSAVALVVTVLVLVLIPVFPGQARADEEESREAPVLVEQAIALIANDAGEERVGERIEDALEAPDKEGVDLGLVRQALEVVEGPGPDETAFPRARVLLLDALGGKLPSSPQSGRFATGTETGTSAVLDEFRPARGIADAGDAVLLGLALAAVISGLWLSHRLRPPHRIRELERQAARQKGKRP